MAAAILPAIIGGGGSVISAIMGANAASDAANANLAANYANIAAGERADLRGLMAARMQRSRDEQGITDAAGNRVQFIPGRGWVTTLSPEQQQLQGMTEAAQLYNLGPGERMRREGVERGASAQRDENLAANALLEEFIRRARTDPNALGNQIYAAGEIGRQEAADRIAEGTARQMVRQGSTSNAADIMSSRAREGSRASEEARRRSVVESRDIAQARDANQAVNLGNLYNMFRQRAVNPTGVPFAPVSPQGPQRPSTGAADAAMINIAARRPVQRDYVQPNYGTANAFAQIGEGVGGALRGYFAQQQLERAQSDLAGQRRLLNQGF